MLVNLTIKYLGKTVDMVVDFDDEKLVDTAYSVGRSFNREVIEDHFLDYAEIEVNVVN